MIDESALRVRRGCIGSAVILIAVIFVLIMSTGNLAWSLLLIVPTTLIIASRRIK